MTEENAETSQQVSSMKQASKTGDFVKSTLVPSLVILLVILTGVGTGWFLSGGQVGPGGVSGKIAVAPGAKVEEGGKTLGLEDTATFRDRAEGRLEEGGIDGEGTHHLVREGGESQNVYLTSSVIDLSQFVGKKVEVWGETNKAQKAGWLMDVGRIKILEK